MNQGGKRHSFAPASSAPTCAPAAKDKKRIEKKKRGSSLSRAKFIYPSPSLISLECRVDVAGKLNNKRERERLTAWTGSLVARFIFVKLPRGFPSLLFPLLV